MIVESITPIDQPPHHTEGRLGQSKCMLSMRNATPSCPLMPTSPCPYVSFGPERIVKPVKRSGLDVLKVSKLGNLGASLMMMVWSSAVAFFVPAPRVVVLPANVMPLVILSSCVQTAVPAGTSTVSPSAACLTAADTSAYSTLFAWMTCPASA